MLHGLYQVSHADSWHVAGILWQEAGGGSWVCKQCSEQVPESEKPTHEDFHLAMEMSREQPGALPSQAISISVARKGNLLQLCLVTRVPLSA